MTNLKKEIEDFIKRLKKVFDSCANETDIWDNQRYDKFRRIYRREMNKLAEELKSKLEMK